MTARNRLSIFWKGVEPGTSIGGWGGFNQRSPIHRRHAKVLPSLLTNVLSAVTNSQADSSANAIYSTY